MAPDDQELACTGDRDRMTTGLNPPVVPEEDNMTRGMCGVLEEIVSCRHLNITHVFPGSRGSVTVWDGLTQAVVKPPLINI